MAVAINPPRGTAELTEERTRAARTLLATEGKFPARARSNHDRTVLRSSDTIRRWRWQLEPDKQEAWTVLAALSRADRKIPGDGTLALPINHAAASRAQCSATARSAKPRCASASSVQAYSHTN